MPKRHHHHHPSIAYTLLEAAVAVAVPIAIAGLTRSSSSLLTEPPPLARAADENVAQARADLGAALARIDELSADCEAIVERVARAAEASSEQEELIKWLQSQLRERMLAPREEELRLSAKSAHDLLRSRSADVARLEKQLAAGAATEQELRLRIQQLQEKT